MYGWYGVMVGHERGCEWGGGRVGGVRCDEVCVRIGLVWATMST